MYDCVMRYSPQNVVTGWTRLYYTLFDCLRRCQACFGNIKHQHPYRGDPAQEYALVDVESAIHAAVQYVNEHHAHCCKINNTDYHQQSDMTSTPIDTNGWGHAPGSGPPPPVIAQILNQGSNKRPRGSGELDDINETGLLRKRPRIGEDEDEDSGAAAPGPGDEYAISNPAPEHQGKGPCSFSSLKRKKSLDPPFSH
ncbi:unnamed protein product, partial [Rhizoctonia solani]